MLELEARAINTRWISTMASMVSSGCDDASSIANCIASMLAMISRASVPIDRPLASLASARASSLAPTCKPSTLDEAIDSVRRRSRASGASSLDALALRAATAFSASETAPAT